MQPLNTIEASESLAPARTSKPRGRPRSVEAHQRVIRATLATCARVGFADLTIEAVARDAAVGKSTIYRHWRNKTDLVAEAIDSQVAKLYLDIDSGDLEKDFRKLIHNLADLFSGSSGKAFARIVGESQANRALSEMVLTRWTKHRQGPIVELVQRYRKSGQIREGFDPEQISELIFGRILLQALVFRDDFDERSIGDLCEIVLHGIAVSDYLARR